MVISPVFLVTTEIIDANNFKLLTLDIGSVPITFIRAARPFALEFLSSCCLAATEADADPLGALVPLAPGASVTDASGSV